MNVDRILASLQLPALAGLEVYTHSLEPLCVYACVCARVFVHEDKAVFLLNFFLIEGLHLLVIKAVKMSFFVP